jgi:non-ribosomal peptide synthetase component F
MRVPINWPDTWDPQASVRQMCLCVLRSLEMVVGVLGILKAGAVRSVDPAYPAEQLTFMLEDARRK